MSEQTESPTITTQTITAKETTAPASGVAPTVPADDLAAARELVMKAYPNAVPELVTGATVAELTASAAKATEVYERIANATKPATATAPTVPAGGAQLAVDLDKLPAHELIRRGLEQLNRRAS